MPQEADAHWAEKKIEHESLKAYHTVEGTHAAAPPHQHQNLATAGRSPVVAQDYSTHAPLESIEGALGNKPPERLPSAAPATTTAAPVATPPPPAPPPPPNAADTSTTGPCALLGE